MNHGSYRVIAWIVSSSNPCRMAWAMTRMRSGAGRARRATMPSSEVSSNATGSRPARPISIERRAFCSDSGKVRPIAIASPTDFIDVVRSGSVPGNFSNVKRGTLVTT